MMQSPVFQNLRGFAPHELLNFLEQIVAFFPDHFRARLKQVVDNLPREGDNMQRVLELVRSQWKDIQSQDWVQIARVGPSQTGKTTLYHALRERQTQPLEPIFGVVETPGLAEYLGYERIRRVPPELAKADMLLLVLDARYQVSEATRKIVEALRKLDKPMLAVLNKMDLVEKPGDALRTARDALDLSVVGVSERDPDSVDRLLNAIMVKCSKALYPLTQTFPEFRRSICNGIVTQSSLASGLVGAIDIPVSDMLPMTAIQTGMLLKIARAFGHRLNRERARELIPMLVAGALVRQGCHGLREAFPRHGRLIGVSVAGLWTFTLGRATIRYFDRFANVIQPPREVAEIRALEAS